MFLILCMSTGFPLAVPAGVDSSILSWIWFQRVWNLGIMLGSMLVILTLSERWEVVG